MTEATELGASGVCRRERQNPLLAEQLMDKLFPGQVEMSSDVAEDFCKRADLELSMGGNCNVVFCAFKFGGDADVATGLARYLVAETAQGLNKLISADIAGKFQAGMISSLTMWSRMTLGFSEGSKWQETASRIMVFSSSRESASVKIEKPRARA